MRILFIHPNIPGQFSHLVGALRADPAHEVWAIGGEAAAARCLQMHPGLNLLAVRRPPIASPSTTHPWAQELDGQVRRGQIVARALQQLKDQGRRFDLIVAHPGWGDALFVKDVFPQTPLLSYFEFFYAAQGADVGFDPEFPAQPDDGPRLRVRNMAQLSALDACDAGLSPTEWQRERFPAASRGRLRVLHEGVDTRVFAPDPAARFEWQGQVFRAGEPILTYVARNLEPYRGFHVLMRTLPAVLQACPQARVIIVGGKAPGYGPRCAHPGGWRGALVDELARQGAPLPASRVLFTGPLPYGEYRKVLQVSAVHAYLTYPFVLSWSMLEAMACGCRLVASRTPPVQEVVDDGVHGRLVDFFDLEGWRRALGEALRDPAGGAAWRAAARERVVAQFDLHGHCLPAGLALLRELAR